MMWRPHLLGAITQSDVDGTLCSPGPLAIVTNATYAPSFPISSPLSTLTKGPPIGIAVGIALGGLTIVSALWLLNWRQARRVQKSHFGPETRENDLLQPMRQSLRPPGDSDFSLPQLRKVQLTHQRGGIRERRLYQILIWLVLELAYFSVVIMACIRPIVLPKLPPQHRAEAKGFMIILTIAWQTLSLYPIRDIVTNVFASEWYHSYERTQELVPGTTDRVSVRTAGPIEEARHFFTSTASWAFRLAFPASLTMLLLGAIAPGVLTVDTVFVHARVSMEVGSISAARTYSTGLLFQDRALLATQTEQFQRDQFNIMLGDHSTIVGFPAAQEMMRGRRNLTYPSDVVKFDYACRWAAPTLIGMDVGRGNMSVVRYGTWAVDGKTDPWELWQNLNTGLAFALDSLFDLASSSASTQDLPFACALTLSCNSYSASATARPWFTHF
jgi:hypothetical protein